jgi:hypothetical protein
MLCGRAYAFWTVAVVTVLMLPAVGQSVISTRSGIVHFWEGAVYLGDHLLESHPGKFPSVPLGVELGTARGRAEVLLTPGVFIRIGENSTIRMIGNELSDTRVELLAGSAVMDSSEANSGTSVRLIYRNWSVRLLEQGVYRIDSDPPRLWVLQGKADVSADTHEGTLSVAQGMNVEFARVLVPERSVGQPHDALSSWVEGRQQSISADNVIAANIQDPASMTISNSSVDSFTYFPMLGLPSLGPGLSRPYGSSDPYPPGFNSVYLSGYSYLPLFLGLGSGGFPTLLRFPPLRLPPVRLPPLRIPPCTGVLPFTSPRATVPHPIPVRPMPTVGTHGGVHR